MGVIGPVIGAVRGRNLASVKQYSVKVIENLSKYKPDGTFEVVCNGRRVVGIPYHINVTFDFTKPRRRSKHEHVYSSSFDDL